MAVAAPSAFTEPAAPTLTASVVSQQCQGGDDVSVVLTAVLSPNRTGVLYAWDLDNDGTFETVPDANPTVTALFPDEMVTTASVAVMKNWRRQANRLDHLRDSALSLMKQRLAKGERRTWNLRSPAARKDASEIAYLSCFSAGPLNSANSDNAAERI